MVQGSRIERELKLESEHALPLEQLGGEPLEHRSFQSTYHDTPERLLARCGITLRRRLENGRNEWQLKLPVDGARREVGILGPPIRPPAELTDLLVALLHGRRLVPLATLRTSRAGVLVQVETGSAEVVNDDVAVLDGQRVTSVFGEVEIELVAGDQRALRDVERAVRRLGARRTDGRPKIARALGLEEATALPPRSDEGRIRRYFMQQYVDLLAADPGVRLGLDVEPVHALRVAVRRLRALLRAAEAHLDAGWAEPLRAELDWLGRAFGPLRDLDVLTAHLRAEADELPEHDRGDLLPALDVLEADRSAARNDALAVIDSERYFALLDTLAAGPRLVESELTLKAVGAKELRKLEKTFAQIQVHASDDLLHRARIRAKRVRYVAEALGEKRVVERAKEFQDVVGEHQDAVVAEERLRTLAGRVPEAGLALGILVERQRLRRRRMRSDLPTSWKRLRKAARRAWT